MISKLRHRLCLFAALLVLQGCGVGYYAESLNGHLEVLAAREKVDTIRQDPSAPAPLREQMDVAAQIRQFSVEELGLPDNASYRSYVDVGRGYVTIAVFAAPEFALEPALWCFPIFGCVPYRAHFWRDNARDAALELRDEGFDVYVSGVTAYSTLGWTADPLLNTMFTFGNTQAAAVVFHELAHQQVYVRNDAAFNEAFAVTVEVAGVKKWLRATGDEAGLAAYLAARQRQADFLRLLDQTRVDLAKIYASTETDETKRAQKAAAIDDLRARYARVKTRQWGGFDGYDGWFNAPINNAQLAASGIYNDLVPDFQRLLAACDGDFPRFYAAAEKLTKLEKAERRAQLSAAECS
ncbi:MAG: aminopeptidase [Pseudomonadota bacterium]